MKRVLLLLLAIPLWGQQVTITGQVLDASGNNARGEVLVEWSNFVYQGQFIAQGAKVVNISSGSFSVALYPGSYFATYDLVNTKPNKLVWIIPEGPPFTRDVLEVQQLVAPPTPPPTGGGGISSINSQMQADQSLQVGNGGTDFAITSNSGLHIFNLPTASGTNRGALAPADFTNFNNTYLNAVLTTGSYSNPSWLTAIAESKVLGPLALVRGGTNQTSWTASRCVRVSDDGLSLESASADCSVGGGSHTILSATHTDTTGSGAEVRGDLLVRNNSSQWGRLALGGVNTVLQGSATDPFYGQLAASQLSNGVTGSGAVALQTGPILRTPLFQNASSGTIFAFTTSSHATPNYIAAVSADPGFAPGFIPAGPDTNIDLTLLGKGTGKVAMSLGGVSLSGGTTGECLKFLDGAAGTLKSEDCGAGNVTVTTPTTQFNFPYWNNTTGQLHNVGFFGVAGGTPNTLVLRDSNRSAQVYDKGAQVQNVVSYGAAGNGSTDDTAAIQAAINAGGVVYLPPTANCYAISGGLTTGNGSASGNSTINGVKLMGGTSSVGASSGAGFSGTSRICWTGSAPGGVTYMYSVLGPLAGWSIEGITFDANGVNNVRGILIQQGIEGQMTDVSVMDNSGGPGIVLTTVFNTGYAWGACRNVFNNVQVLAAGGGSGIELTGSGSLSLDSCSNTFIGGMFVHDAGTSNTHALLLQYADNNSFHRTNFLHYNSGGTNSCGIKFDNSVVSTFPNENSFFGTTSSSGVCGNAGTSSLRNIFWGVNVGDCSLNCDFRFWGGTTRSIVLTSQGEEVRQNFIWFDNGFTLSALQSTYNYLSDDTVIKCSDCNRGTDPCTSGGPGTIAYKTSGPGGTTYRCW